MAIVGEANILVRAITTGVENDIKRAFQGISGQSGASRKSGESLGSAFSRGFNSNANGDIFSKLAEGISSMEPAADAARQKFTSLVRTSYTVGTGISVLIGGIASLASGFISLVGAAGAASVSVLGLAGTFVSLRLGAFAAKLALGGIGAAFSSATKAQGGLGKSLAEINKQFKELRRNAESAAMSEKRAGLELEKARNNLARTLDLPPNNMARREAELALEEAELNYRQAKERSKDLNAELKKGKKGIADSVNGGGADPYAGLTKSQKEFAKALVALKPKLDELKEAVAQGFLPKLREQLEILAKGKFFDVVKKGLTGLGVALGIGAENFTKYLDSSENVKKIGKIFDQAVPTIEAFGTILGKSLDAFLSVLIYADPLVKKFVAFLDKNIGKFADFMNAPENKAEIKAFFETVSQLATDFGDIFGNVFGGFGKIIKANIGPGSGGQILIDYLKDATAQFKNLETIDGKPLKEFFAGAATNAGAILSSVGALLGEIFKLADNPALKETFDILKEGAAPLGSILDKYIEAGPSFARLVVTLTKISDKLTDSVAMEIFFDTLNSIATVIDQALGNETIKAIADITGRVLAFFSAIGLVIGGFTFLRSVFLGTFGVMFKKLASLVAFFARGGSFDGIRLAFMYFFDGVKVVFGKIGGIVKTVGSMLSGIAGKIIGLFSRVIGSMGAAFARFGGMILGVARTIGIGLRIAFAANPVGFIITAVLLLVSALTWFFTQTEVGKEIWANFMEGITKSLEVVGGVFDTFFTNLGTAWTDLIKFFKTFDLGAVFKGMLNGLIGFFEALLNNIIIGFNNGLLKSINNIKLDIPQWVRDAGKAVGLSLPSTFAFNLAPGKTIKIPRLADGGTVMPSRGGSIVNVAEAGRPERIEPLDPDGLSRRDKSLIKELSGTNGMTVNVYPSASMNERELADLVSRRIAFEIRKGSF